MITEITRDYIPFIATFRDISGKAKSIAFEPMFSLHARQIILHPLWDKESIARNFLALYLNLDDERYMIYEGNTLEDNKVRLREQCSINLLEFIAKYTFKDGKQICDAPPEVTLDDVFLEEYIEDMAVMVKEELELFKTYFKVLQASARHCWSLQECVHCGLPFRVKCNCPDSTIITGVKELVKESKTYEGGKKLIDLNKFKEGPLEKASEQSSFTYFGKVEELSEQKEFLSLLREKLDDLTPEQAERMSMDDGYIAKFFQDILKESPSRQT